MATPTPPWWKPDFVWTFNPDAGKPSKASKDILFFGFIFSIYKENVFEGSIY